MASDSPDYGLPPRVMDAYKEYLLQSEFERNMALHRPVSATGSYSVGDAPVEKMAAGPSKKVQEEVQKKLESHKHREEFARTLRRVEASGGKLQLGPFADWAPEDIPRGIVRGNSDEGSLNLPCGFKKFPRTRAVQE
jgi:hypothetical protein